MKRISKLLCIILVTTVIILSIPTAVSSYDYYTYHSFKSFNEVRLLQNENEVFLIGSDNNKISIEGVYPNTYNIELTLENSAYTFNLFDSTLIIACRNKNSGQLQIVLYNIDTDNFTTFSISDTDCPEFSQLGYDGTCVYLSDDSGNVRKYSLHGKLLHTYNLHHDAVFLSVNYSGDVYAITNNGLYELYDNSAKLISYLNADAPVRFINNNTFINDSGYYHKINSNNIKRLSDSKSTVYYPSGGIIDNHMLVADNNTLYGVNINNNEYDKYISFSNYIEEICVIGSAILTLSYQNGLPTVSKAMYSDMTKINQNNSELEITDNDTDIANAITSDVYTIDNNKQTITGINYSTTIAEFKRNINYDGFDVSFTRYGGKKIKSGNVGTATIAKFYNDDYFIEYELSVTGDLTGEGNLNSRDKKLMFSYFLDDVMFTGVFVDSADFDNSDNIDLIDLVLLMRAIDAKK